VTDSDSGNPWRRAHWPSLALWKGHHHWFWLLAEQKECAADDAQYAGAELASHAGCTKGMPRGTRISRQGFQYVKVKGFQRQFAHPAPIFFERFLTEISRGCSCMFLLEESQDMPGYALMAM